MTPTGSQVMQVIDVLDKIDIRLRTLDNERRTLQEQIDQIERLGWVDAKPHYRNGKYLYLIYPMVDGERRREYIGADPDKIQDALDRMERKDQYETLNRQLANKDHQIVQIRNYILQAWGACNW